MVIIFPNKNGIYILEASVLGEEGLVFGKSVSRSRHNLSPQLDIGRIRK